MLAGLMADLYGLTRDYASDSGRASHEGHAFEDQVVRVLLSHKDGDGLVVFDARMTSPFRTYSCLRPQLDGAFRHGSRYYFIECKHRKAVMADHIAYFNSKLLDYALGAHVAGLEHEVKGLFLATSPVGDNQLMYALAYGIIVIDPETPALCHMIGTAKNDDLKHALLRLHEQLEEPVDYSNPCAVDPETLVKSYRYLVHKWREDQGG